MEWENTTGEALLHGLFAGQKLEVKQYFLFKKCMFGWKMVFYKIYIGSIHCPKDLSTGATLFSVFKAPSKLVIDL